MSHLSCWILLNESLKIFILDENENDLDFEDSIDKNHATSNELIKNSLSKQSLLVIIV